MGDGSVGPRTQSGDALAESTATSAETPAARLLGPQVECPLPGSEEGALDVWPTPAPQSTNLQTGGGAGHRPGAQARGLGPLRFYGRLQTTLSASETRATVPRPHRV